MTARFADFLWTFRWWLTVGIVVGAIFLAPRADLTKIDNDITAWFSKADPIYREYDRFREEFGGTRTLIIALDVAPDAADAAAGVFTEERLRFIDERVRRARAGADGGARQQPRHRDARDGDAAGSRG